MNINPQENSRLSYAEKKLASKQSEYVLNLAVGSALLTSLGLFAHFNNHNQFAVYILLGLIVNLFTIPFIYLGINEKLIDWLYTSVFIFDIVLCSIWVQNSQYDTLPIASIMGIGPLFVFCLLKTTRVHMFTYGVFALSSIFFLGFNIVSLTYFAIMLFTLKVSYGVFTLDQKVALLEKELTKSNINKDHLDYLNQDVLRPLKNCRGSLKIIDDLLDDELNRRDLRTRISHIHSEMDLIEQKMAKRKIN